MTRIQDLNSSQTNIEVIETNTITANFQKKKFSLIIGESPGGKVSGHGTFEYESEANISAIANEGYTFSNWNGTGIRNPGSPDTTVLMSEERNISAVFTIKQYILSAAGGEVKGSGIYNHGSEVEIYATLRQATPLKNGTEAIQIILHLLSRRLF